jgi:hypothetical protein
MSVPPVRGSLSANRGSRGGGSPGHRNAQATGLVCHGFPVGLPRHLPSGDSGSGHGPFGEKAFKAALVGCVVLVVIGVLMVAVGGAATRSVGASFIVLAVLGLVTAGAGLLAERMLGRRPPPPPKVRAGNGRGPHPPDGSRIGRGRP